MTYDVDLVTENTAQAILAAEQQRNAYLSAIAQSSFDAESADLSYIQRVVQQGLAPQLFGIGDQIVVPYTESGTTYDMPFDIVHFGDVELEDGETVPGMWLQSHYATLWTIMYDQSEALYYCEEALPAGTYYFTIGTTWGSNCVAGTSYYFTTSVDIPAGGQIRIGLSSESSAWGAPDQSPSNWHVHTYESPSATTALETRLTLTEGAEGTELGTTTTAIKYDASDINNLQRAAYGYNRWSQSAYRQYLNSAASTGSWWTPQNRFDRAPSQLGSYPGFMAGFEDDFLNVLKPVKVTTALNTVSDSEIGTSEDTYDTFFLPSLEQIYVTPQLSDVEGDYWEYWRRAVGASSPQATGGTYAERITYALENHASAQNVRLRSATHSNSGYVWRVGSSGNVNSGGGASNAYHCAPACVIC